MIFLYMELLLCGFFDMYLDVDKGIFILYKDVIGVVVLDNYGVMVNKG